MSKDKITIQSLITLAKTKASAITIALTKGSLITDALVLQSPIGIESIVVAYSNGIVTNSIFGEVAVFDFDVVANFSGDVVFTVDWGAQIGETEINATLVDGVPQSLDTSIEIPEGVDASQTVNVTDSLGGSFAVGYTVESEAIPVPELHYWPFLGNTEDIVGGNDGINNGATLTQDKAGNPNSAYSFNSSGNWIDLTSLSNIGTVHSITVRVKMVKYVAMFPRSTTGNYFYIISKNLVRYRAAGNVDFATSDINLNEYLDFALVRNNLSVKLYINGVQEGIEQTLADNNDFTLNLLTANTTWWFGGVMDNMRIYNRAITQDEIDLIHAEL